MSDSNLTIGPRLVEHSKYAGFTSQTWSAIIGGALKLKRIQIKTLTKKDHTWSLHQTNMAMAVRPNIMPGQGRSPVVAFLHKCRESSLGQAQLQLPTTCNKLQPPIITDNTQKKPYRGIHNYYIYNIILHAVKHKYNKIIYKILKIQYIFSSKLILRYPYSKNILVF